MATMFMYRAPGMTMWRLPIFTWDMVVTSLLILMAFPPLTAALSMLLIDRHFGGHFFDPAATAARRSSTSICSGSSAIPRST